MIDSPALGRFHLIERTAPAGPSIADVEREVGIALDGLRLERSRLHGATIAVAAGSRGIASLREVVRAACRWLQGQGARPFVFPAMGSHGGATDEGQRQILTGYGVTPDFVGAEVRCSMAAVEVGCTPEGFPAFMDRTAWESDGVLVINRVKPHTGFSGRVESGLLKMLTVGMGKEQGASQFHRMACRHGYEPVIRAVSRAVLGTGKILGGLALAENSRHELAVIRGATPENMVSVEEETLALVKSTAPRIPFSHADVLVVDEIGKNISGSGMDTKVIGRGVSSAPGEVPEIRVIYARDLTEESGGNGLGAGLADIIHERLYRKIDFARTHVNGRTSLHPEVVAIPMWLGSDREALDFALRVAGSPGPAEQRIVWIRNTLALDRILVSEALVAEAPGLDGWRLNPQGQTLAFDGRGNLAVPVFETVARVDCAEARSPE
jgi:Lactate racemase N-terminal domain